MPLALLQDAVAVAAVVLLLHVVRVDFRELRIRNASVLALIGLYAVWTALGGFATLPGDLGAGALLFAIGFVMWLAGAMGAGDAKLYFGLGLFVGVSHLAVFAALLALASILFFVVLVTVGRSGATAGLAGRLVEIRRSGKAPFAVPMCAAAIPAMLLRAFG